MNSHRPSHPTRPFHSFSYPLFYPVSSFFSHHQPQFVSLVVTTHFLSHPLSTTPYHIHSSSFITRPACFSILPASPSIAPSLRLLPTPRPPPLRAVNRQSAITYLGESCKVEFLFWTFKGGGDISCRASLIFQCESYPCEPCTRKSC